MLRLISVLAATSVVGAAASPPAHAVLQNQEKTEVSVRVGHGMSTTLHVSRMGLAAAMHQRFKHATHAQRSLYKAKLKKMGRNKPTDIFEMTIGNDDIPCFCDFGCDMLGDCCVTDFCEAVGLQGVPFPRPSPSPSDPSPSPSPEDPSPSPSPEDPSPSPSPEDPSPSPSPSPERASGPSPTAPAGHQACDPTSEVGCDFFFNPIESNNPSYAYVYNANVHLSQCDWANPQPCGIATVDLTTLQAGICTFDLQPIGAPQGVTTRDGELRFTEVPTDQSCAPGFEYLWLNNDGYWEWEWHGSESETFGDAAGDHAIETAGLQ